MMNKIIITGGSHHNTYGVVRSLGVKGIKSFVLLVSEEKDSFLLHSKYVQNFKIVKNEAAAIDFLCKNEKEYEGAVLIACSDGMSSALDCNKKALSKYQLPGSVFGERKITELMNKDTMTKLGKDVGLNVPQSWVVETGGAINQVLYPCITKPILSKDGHKADISICHTPQELAEVISTGSCYKYQIQEFIEKDFEYQLIGLSLHGGREIIIPGFSRCIRPCPRTNTGFLHYEALDNINAPLSKCKDFVKRTGYSGLFSIEFLRDKKGNDYFMEMNFRNDGNAICVTASGTNMPYIWYLANTGGNYLTEINKSTFKSVYVMPEFADFFSFVYTKRITLLKWLKDVLRTDTFMVFNVADIKPFFIVLRSWINRFWKKVLRRK